MPVGSYTRRLARFKPTTLHNGVGQEPPHRHRVRDAFVGLEQGLHLALLVAAHHGQTSDGPGLTLVAATRFGSVSTNAIKIGRHLGYLWATHPEIADGSVHHVQAVSSRVTLSPPSRCQAARSPAPTTPFTTVPGTQKSLLLIGKGS